MYRVFFCIAFHLSLLKWRCSKVYPGIVAEMVLPKDRSDANVSINSSIASSLYVKSRNLRMESRLIVRVIEISDSDVKDW